MAKFIAIPSFDIYKNGTWAEPEQWWLDGPCVYQSDVKGTDGKPIRVTAPDDFLTDLASIPRLARLLIPKNGNSRAAAVIHDWLCRTEETTRKIADKIFLEAMGIIDAATHPKKIRKWLFKLRRNAMYYAVRIGALRKGK